MSFFGKLMKGVAKVGLPILGTALGGPLGGIAAGALGGAIGHGKPNLGNIAGGAVGGALGGVGGGALKTVGGSGLLGKVGSFAMNHLDPIMAGASLLQGHNAEGRANKLNDQAAGIQQQQYQDYQPIGAKGRAGLMNDSRRDLTTVFGGTQNPFENQAGAAPSAYNPSQMPPEAIRSVGGPAMPPQIADAGAGAPMDPRGAPMGQAIRRLRTV